MRFGSAVAFFSLSLWCVGFPLPILLSRLPNVHNAIRSIGPKLGHPALQKTEGSDAGFSWWETTEGALYSASQNLIENLNAQQ